MKKNETEKLDFKKSTVSNLTDTQLSGIKGGTGQRPTPDYLRIPIGSVIGKPILW